MKSSDARGRRGTCRPASSIRPRCSATSLIKIGSLRSNGRAGGSGVLASMVPTGISRSTRPRWSSSAAQRGSPLLAVRPGLPRTWSRVRGRVIPQGLSAPARAPAPRGPSAPPEPQHPTFPAGFTPGNGDSTRRVYGTAVARRLPRGIAPPCFPLIFNLEKTF